jgi:hypothetical protein
MQVIVRVSYNSEVLGKGIFWEGPSSKINLIRNIPARMVAEEVVKDGKTRETGMWKVEVVG